MPIWSQILLLRSLTCSLHCLFVIHLWFLCGSLVIHSAKISFSSCFHVILYLYMAKVVEFAVAVWQGLLRTYRITNTNNVIDLLWYFIDIDHLVLFKSVDKNMRHLYLFSGWIWEIYSTFRFDFETCPAPTFFARGSSVIEYLHPEGQCRQPAMHYMLGLWHSSRTYAIT